MRPAACVSAVLVALAAVALGHAGPRSVSTTGAARPTVACPTLRPTVELTFGEWGGPGTLLRRRERFAAVGSWGSERLGGYVIFASATPTAAFADRDCSRTSAPTRRDGGLSQPYRYRRAGDNAYFEGRDGERLLGELLHPRSISAIHLREPSGVGFSCRVSGRIVAQLTDVTQGGRSAGTTLRVFASGRLLAVAVLHRSGASSFRVAEVCVPL